METSHPVRARPTSTLHGLGELIAYLPYVFGFHLTDSIVVVGSERGTVIGSARIDVVDDPRTQRAMIDLVLDQMAHAPAQSCDVILFGDTGAARELARDVASLLRRDVAPVHHLMVVRPAKGAGPARWQLASCRCGRGCRVGWGDVPDADRVPMVAERVLEGRAPLADRVELEASLRPRPLVSRAVEAIHRPVPRPAEYTRSLAQVLDLSADATAVERLPVPVLADVLHGLLDAHVRDNLLARLVPGRLREEDARPDLSAHLNALGSSAWPSATHADPDVRARMQERLRTLVTCAPEPLVAAPATVFAYWTWSAGGGALTSIALQRALLARPDYRLAQLLLQIVQHGLRPGDLARAEGATE